MLNFFSKDLGIDLGTANSLVYVKDRGIVLAEPSLAAVNVKTNQVLAIGEEARKMVGRTPAHISVIRPLLNGVISDFEMTEEMLRHFFKRATGSRLLNFFRAVVGVPTNLTEVERKSVEDAILSAGAARAYLMEEPVAAALGARLPIEEPTANMIVDIGGGTTEIAILSMGGVVVARSLKVAGDKLNDDIIKFVRDEYKLAIGEPTAEELKITIGSAIPLDERLEFAIRGRDMTTGLPREVAVKSTQVRAALARSVRTIVETVKEVIESAPPELVGDILRQGIYLSGGGSLLRGMDALLNREIGVAAQVVEDPLTCVVRGAGMAAQNLDRYEHLFALSPKPAEISI